jgi:hypothetical protein
MGIEIRERQRRHCRPNIDPNDAHPLFVEVKKTRTPSPQRVTVSPFSYPSFIDQLLSNDRDRAALQTRVTS